MHIRPISKEDKNEVFELMRVFYSTDAVSSDGSPEIFESDIDACLNNSPYLEGYVFCEENRICGYGMLAKSFSTEFGKPCIWLEDIYIKEEHRGKGMGSEFLNFVSDKSRDCVIRLEVEDYNKGAIRAYSKAGFCTLPYMEMIKN